MTSLFVEYVKGVPLLKAFAESEALDRRLEVTVAKFGESSKAASRNRALVLSAYSFVADLAFVVMAAGGALLVQSGSLPLFVYIGFIVAPDGSFAVVHAGWRGVMDASTSMSQPLQLLAS